MTRSPFASALGSHRGTGVVQREYEALNLRRLVAIALETTVMTRVPMLDWPADLFADVRPEIAAMNNGLLPGRLPALSLSSHGLNSMWSQAIPAGAGVSTAQSRFESIALRAGKVPPETGDLLGVLLASTFSCGGRGCQVLHPLWADEARHRAYSFVRLIDTRNHRSESTGEDPIGRAGRGCHRP